MAETALAEQPRTAEADDPIARAFEDGRNEVYELDGKRYTVHPATALFPLLEGAEFESLVDSIRERGVRHPVLVRGSEIVDGRNRARAAREAGILPPVVELAEDDDPCIVVADENLQRRDLPQTRKVVLASQLRRLSLRIAERKRGVAGTPISVAKPSAEPASDGSGGGGDVPASAPGGGSASPDGGDDASSTVPSDEAVPAESGESAPLTQETAAKALGVTARSVRNVDRVVEKAPELEQELAAGNISIRDAMAVSEEAPEVRRQAVDDVKAGRAKSASQAVEKRTGRAPKAAAARRSRSRTDKDKDKAVAGELAGVPPLPSAGGGGDASAAAGASGRDAAPTAAGKAVPAPVLPAEALSPSLLMAGVRLTLGILDLDPCSSDEGQDRVGASDWFTREQDGLRQAWRGSCYVFPPPAQAPAFAAKLLNEMTAGRVEKAAFLAPACLAEDWAVRLMTSLRFSGLAVERERMQYDVEGGSPVQAGKVMGLYLFGVDPASLFEFFDPWGVVLTPARAAA